MLAFISLFFPAAIMVGWKRRLFKEEYDWKAMLMEYIAGVILINFLVIAISYLFFGSRGDVASNINSYNNFALKYLLLSSFFAVALPWLYKKIKEYKQGGSVRKELKTDTEEDIKIDRISGSFSLRKYWVEITVFLYLFIRLRYCMPDSLYENITLYPYVVSYQKLGLGSRFFIGSVLQIFTDYISVDLVYRFIFFATVFFIALLAILFGRVVRKADESDRLSILAIAAVWLFSPLSTNLFTGSTYGRMELFLQILVLLMLVCANNRFSAWLIPALTVICMAIYQNFIFLYCMPILIILLYKTFAAEERKVRLNYGIVLIVTVVLACASFLVFQFVRNLTVESAEEMLAVISGYSDYPIESDAEYGLRRLYEEYFKSWTDRVAGLNHTLMAKRFILMLVFFSPIIAIFCFFYKEAIRYSKKNYMKWIYRSCCVLSPLAAIPTFLLVTDYGRWISAIFFMQFALLMYFISQKDVGAAGAFQEIYGKIRTNPVGYMVLLLYLVSLGQIHIDSVLTIIQDIIDGSLLNILIP